MAWTLDEIREGLQGLRLEVVAAETELSYNTLRRYASGAVTNPPHDVIVRLSEWLDRSGIPKISDELTPMERYRRAVEAYALAEAEADAFFASTPDEAVEKSVIEMKSARVALLRQRAEALRERAGEDVPSVEDALA